MKRQVIALGGGGFAMENKDSLEGRFANPNIKDSVSRICSESAAKLPKFLIPTLQENLAQGGSIKYATFLLAAWCYYSDKGVNEKNEPLDIIDTQKEILQQAAKPTTDHSLSFVQLKEVFGTLAQNQRFAKLYTEMVQLIYTTKNIRELMRSICQIAEK